MDLKRYEQKHCILGDSNVVTWSQVTKHIFIEWRNISILNPNFRFYKHVKKGKIQASENAFFKKNSFFSL